MELYYHIVKRDGQGHLTGYRGVTTSREYAMQLAAEYGATVETSLSQEFALPSDWV